MLEWLLLFFRRDCWKLRANLWLGSALINIVKHLVGFIVCRREYLACEEMDEEEKTIMIASFSLVLWKCSSSALLVQFQMIFCKNILTSLIFRSCQSQHSIGIHLYGMNSKLTDEKGSAFDMFWWASTRGNLLLFAERPCYLYINSIGLGCQITARFLQAY